ncbi:MAG: glycosyltransferase [Tepidisphaeraceae bacterium]
MLSVVIPFRNIGDFAGLCLFSIGETIRQLNLLDQTEFILIDDASDPSNDMAGHFERFRKSTPARTTLLMLRSRQYYTYACSLGFSTATGDTIMLVSHDMIVPPGYVRTLLRLAKAHPSLGILRGSSEHIDGFPQHVIKPPAPCRNYGEVCQFSEQVASGWSGELFEDRALIADSVMVTRNVLDKIGVMDTRFRHLFGDLDWGLRAQRAGFKLVCARGAWLHHEGGGHAKKMIAGGTSVAEVDREMKQLVTSNFEMFRKKWGEDLPTENDATMNEHFQRLRALPPRPDDYVPPLKIDPAVCTVL